MNSGYCVGIFIAAALSSLSARYGWRAMFADRRPAALFASPTSVEREGAGALNGSWSSRSAAGGLATPSSLFSPEYLRAILNCVFLLISMIGLWAGPSTPWRGDAGRHARRSQRRRGRAHRVLGDDAAGRRHDPRLPGHADPANRFGRRGALAWFYATMALSISIGFGTRSTCRAVRCGRSSPACSLSASGRKLRRLLGVAGGAISHRVPRQRARFRQLYRTIRRGRRDVPGRDRNSTLRQHGRAGRPHGRAVRDRHPAVAVRRRDKGKAAARLVPEST